MGITSLLIEGGAAVAASALQAKELWIKSTFFTHLKSLGGDDGDSHVPRYGTATDVTEHSG